jgi:transketolase
MDLHKSALSEGLNEESIGLRQLILETVASGGRGHIGSALSLIELINTLYASVMRHNPSDPDWSDRDIFILSKGHGCLGLYAVLAKHGYFPPSELETFCKFDSRLGGHPEWNDLPGVEFSTGSLGHGLAVGTGIAKAFKMKGQNQRKVFVLLGDGELGEGSVWESASHASKHNLNNLCLLVDYNHMQSYGDVEEVLPLRNLKSKWESFGFDAIEINGHSIQSIKESVAKLGHSPSPLVVIAHTIKGKGFPPAENSASWHHKASISREEISYLLRGEK